VDEHVVAAIDRRDEAEALLRIEEFHDTCGHYWLLSDNAGTRVSSELADHSASALSEFGVDRRETHKGAASSAQQNWNALHIGLLPTKTNEA
jgi:hypothetical protein